MAKRKGYTATGVELATDMFVRLKALAKHEELSVGHFIRRALGLYVTARLKTPDVTPEVKAKAVDVKFTLEGEIQCTRSK